MKQGVQKVSLFEFPNKVKMKIFFTWGIVTILAFPLVYGFTNYMAAKTAERYNFWFTWETQTPFIKEFIWFYLSLNIALILPLFMSKAEDIIKYCQTILFTLLLASIIFILFPTQLGFSRVIPEDNFYKNLYATLLGLDHPHNLVPSLHVTFSAIALYVSVYKQKKLSLISILFGLWFIMIMLSVVFVRQHHLLDIVFGFLLAVIGIRTVFLKNSSKTFN